MDILKVLCILAVVGSSCATFTTQCRDCICRAEGCQNNQFTCNGQTPEACGPYQITLAYYCDANDYVAASCYEYEDEWRQCANNWSCNNATVDRYMARYGEECTNLADPSCEHYAKLHKGGNLACYSEETYVLTFWNSVNNCCNSRYPNQCD